MTKRVTYLIAVIIASQTSACVKRHTPVQCIGELDLRGISGESKQKDALHTIQQFITLDKKIELYSIQSSALDVVRFTSDGDECKKFADSFLDSSMSIFDGIAYRELSRN